MSISNDINNNPSNVTKESLIIAKALKILKKKHRKGRIVGLDDTKNFLTLKLAEMFNEVFCVLFLDNQHRIIQFEEMFHGTINVTSVYPRVIVQRVLELNAAAVIFAHNHPSGVSKPSSADICITHRLRDALALIDVRVLDHIIISIEGTTSLAEIGEL